MSVSLLTCIYLLILSNALACGGVIIFLWVMLNRQKAGFQYMITRLNRLEKQYGEKKVDTKTPRISIPVDEPISKYEQVSLPDDVKINFIED